MVRGRRLAMRLLATLVGGLLGVLPGLLLILFGEAAGGSLLGMPGLSFGRRLRHTQSEGRGR